VVAPAHGVFDAMRDSRTAGAEVGDSFVNDSGAHTGNQGDKCLFSEISVANQEDDSESSFTIRSKASALLSGV
jgi:hypothetical protein